MYCPVKLIQSSVFHDIVTFAYTYFTLVVKWYVTVLSILQLIVSTTLASNRILSVHLKYECPIDLSSKMLLQKFVCFFKNDCDNNNLYFCQETKFQNSKCHAKGTIWLYVIGRIWSGNNDLNFVCIDVVSQVKIVSRKIFYLYLFQNCCAFSLSINFFYLISLFRVNLYLN